MSYTMNTCTNCWGSFLEETVIDVCPVCGNKDIIYQPDYKFNETIDGDSTTVTEVE